MSAISTVDVTLGDVTFHLSTSGEPGSLPVLWLHGSGPSVTALTNWHGALGFRWSCGCGGPTSAGVS